MYIKTRLLITQYKKNTATRSATYYSHHNFIIIKIERLLLVLLVINFVVVNFYF